MASNPGRIPAGGRDKISVEVKTSHHGGSTLNKGFTVYTNDPKRPQVRLMVTGQVMGYIIMSPTYIRFMGHEGEPLTRTVSIKPSEGHGFHIKDVKAREGEHLSFDWKPVGADGAKNGYELLVRNTMQTAGTYQDLITITTDSSEKPILRIPVSARIQKTAQSQAPSTQ